MTEFAERFDDEANEMMNEIIGDAMDGAPTITPFLSLGTNDPALEIMDGPTSSHQAKANTLFEAFDDGNCNESRLKNSGMLRDEAYEL